MPASYVMSRQFYILRLFLGKLVGICRMVINRSAEGSVYVAIPFRIALFALQSLGDDLV